MTTAAGFFVFFLKNGSFAKHVFSSACVDTKIKQLATSALMEKKTLCKLVM